MNLDGWGLAIGRAVLFALTACLVSVQVFGTLFGIGDGGGTIGFHVGTWLLATCAGILTLGVTTFGTLTKCRFFAFAGFVGALLVLPMAALYTWGMLRADIINSTQGYRQQLWVWFVDTATLPLTLIAILISWRSIRQKAIQRELSRQS